MALKITNKRWVYIDQNGRDTRKKGYPILRLTFTDGRVANVHHEQKVLALGFPAAALGPDFEDESFTIPRKNSQNIHPQTLPGFTTEPEVVKAVREFCEAVQAGEFSPQLFA